MTKCGSRMEVADLGGAERSNKRCVAAFTAQQLWIGKTQKKGDGRFVRTVRIVGSRLVLAGGRRSP